jgi:RES domain-containing protein
MPPKLELDLPTKAFGGSAYKLIDQDFSDEPLSTTGSDLHNGRYHIMGSYPMLYLGLSPETCVAEVASRLSDDDAGLSSISVIQHFYDLWEYRVECECIVDLTDTDTLAHLGVNTNELISDSHHVTQPLGQHLYDNLERLQALLTPSARYHDGCCLALWMDRLDGKGNKRACAVTALLRTPQYWP